MLLFFIECVSEVRRSGKVKRSVKRGYFSFSPHSLISVWVSICSFLSSLLSVFLISVFSFIFFTICSPIILWIATVIKYFPSCLFFPLSWSLPLAFPHFSESLLILFSSFLISLHNPLSFPSLHCLFSVLSAFLALCSLSLLFTPWLSPLPSCPLAPPL